MDEQDSKQVLNHQLIFKAELLKMLKKGTLNQSQYEKILERYELTYKEPVKSETTKQPVVKTPAQVKQSIKAATAEESSTIKTDLHEDHRATINPKDTYQTILLTLGVILVLLAGIVFATTTWDVYDNLMKLVFLSSGSLIFFLASVIAEKKLKIAKTGLAFWSLGSLYIPILFLGIGFFDLFGVYLSLSGDGRYLFGAVSTLVATPVYYYSTKKYKQPVFGYVTLGCVSLLAVFLGLHIEEDAFVLLLMLSLVNAFNSVAGTSLYKSLLKNETLSKCVTPYHFSNTLILSVVMLWGTSFLEKNLVSMFFYGLMILTYIYTPVKHQIKDKVLSVLPGVMTTVTAVYLTHASFRYLELDVLTPYYYGSLVGTFTVLFFGLYFFNQFDGLKTVKYPSLITNSVGFLVLFIANLALLEFTYNTIYMFIALVLASLVYVYEKRDSYKIGYGIIMYGLYLGMALQSYEWIDEHLTISFFNYFTVTYAVLFILILVLRYLEQSISFIHIRIYLLSLVPLLVIVTNWIYYSEETVYVIPYVIMNHVVLLTCFFAYEKLFKPVAAERSLILIGNLIAITFSVFYILRLIDQDATSFTFISSTLTIIGLSYLLKKEWRIVISHYVLGSLFLALTIHTYYLIEMVSKTLSSRSLIDFLEQTMALNLASILVSVILLIRLIHKHRYMFLLPIALGLATTSLYLVGRLITHNAVYDNSQVESFNVAPWIQIGFGLLLFVLGNLVFKQLVTMKQLKSEKRAIQVIKNVIQIDYYYLLYITNLLVAYVSVDSEFIPLLTIDLLLVGSIFYQLRRTNDTYMHKSIISLGSYLVLLPYSRIINEIVSTNVVYFYELILIPVIVVTAYVCQKVFKEQLQVTRLIDLAVVCVVVGMLFIDVLKDDLLSAIVFFILTLGLIVYGYAKQYIVYFGIGLGYLVIFVFYETRYFWTSIPWWAYLLLAGLVLIFISSMNEIEKRYEFSFKEKIKNGIKYLNK